MPNLNNLGRSACPRAGRTPYDLGALAGEEPSAHPTAAAFWRCLAAGPAQLAAAAVRDG